MFMSGHPGEPMTFQRRERLQRHKGGGHENRARRGAMTGGLALLERAISYTLGGLVLVASKYHP